MEILLLEIPNSSSLQVAPRAEARPENPPPITKIFSIAHPRVDRFIIAPQVNTRQIF